MQPNGDSLIDALRAKIIELKYENLRLREPSPELKTLAVAVKQIVTLKTALEAITKIEDRYNCGDWDEIEEARSIVQKALDEVTNG